MIKRYLLLLLIFQLINCYITCAQFDFLNSSRFSRAIGMGNSYIGVAEGVETTFYNSAGLTFLDYYGVAYTYGEGSQYLVETTPFDIAIVIPFSRTVGNFALSSHHLFIDDDKAMINNSISSIYRLHYSKLLLQCLSIGSSINYYYYNVLQLTDSECSFPYII